MPVPFGLAAGTLVATPQGPRPIEDLQPGDPIWAHDPEAEAPVARAVAARDEAVVDHVVAIEAQGLTLGGITPGTNVYDAFDEMFRAAASLSTLAQVLAWTGEGATPAAQPIHDVPEHHRPGTRVVQLTLTGEEGAFFADGALVKARLPEAG